MVVVVKDLISVLLRKKLFRCQDWKDLNYGPLGFEKTVLSSKPPPQPTFKKSTRTWKLLFLLSHFSIQPEKVFLKVPRHKI